jgi:colanic acid/amylovoran biosynthesis glycosyltransferase
MKAPIAGRILLVAYNFPSVSQTFIVDQFLHLLARGWDVHLIATKQTTHLAHGAPEIAASPELSERIHYSGDLSASIRALNPQVVHFEFGNLALGHLGACRDVGAASVVGFRGYDACYQRLDVPGYYDEVWNHATMLHCASEALWQRLQQRGCPPEMPHRVVPDGIDLDFFDPGDRVHTGVTGTPERPLKLLSVGRLVWKKGHPYAVQALAELEQRGVHARLTIIGGGSLGDEIYFTAWDLGVFDRIAILGSRPRAQVRMHAERADVFVSASVSEGFGVSVLEGQAMKLPVVCTDAEGLIENVLDGETGFVVPRRDPSAMADRLAVLASDPELRQRMGVAGRERVKTMYRIDQEIDGFEWLYYDAIELKEHESSVQGHVSRA